MTQDKNEVELEKECLRISLPIALKFSEDFQKAYPDKRPIHELMGELNEAIKDILLSILQGNEELRLENKILRGNRQADSADIERLERENAELKERLATMKGSEL